VYGALVAAQQLDDRAFSASEVEKMFSDLEMEGGQPIVIILEGLNDWGLVEIVRIKGSDETYYFAPPQKRSAAKRASE
jgi:hypothetical protein